MKVSNLLLILNHADPEDEVVVSLYQGDKKEDKTLYVTCVDIGRSPVRINVIEIIKD